MPQERRRYIGVWASDGAFNGRGRQAMLIITDVDARGYAKGYYAWGPAGPGTPPRFAAFPAGAHPVSGKIAGSSVTFDNGNYKVTAKFSDERSVQLTHQYANGPSGQARGVPLWTAAPSR